MTPTDDLRSRFAELAAWQQSLVGWLAVIVGGLAVIWVLRRYTRRVLRRAKALDATLRSFLSVLITSGAWVVFAIVILTRAGVNLSALLGGLAIGGFVLGFALKDTLGNLAAGVMLLFYRPFNIRDTVTVDGQEGQVVTLGMALTTLKTGDGRIITFPNGRVLGGAVTNHTREPTRRADILVGISYDDDIDAAVKAILAALADDPRILQDPAPTVRITALGQSSVDLQVRPWVNTADYWALKAELHGVVKGALEAAGCTIPYPQRDIRIVERPQ